MTKIVTTGLKRYARTEFVLKASNARGNVRVDDSHFATFGAAKRAKSKLDVSGTHPQKWIEKHTVVTTVSVVVE